MNLREYQINALSTAMFPVDQAISYCTLGLVGEVAELLEINRGPYQVSHANVNVAELGDVCWYIVVLAHHSRIELSGDLCAYTFTSHGFGRCATITEMAICAGLIANKAKKVIRDGKAVDADWLHLQLGRLLAYANDYAVTYLDVPFATVLEENLKKLASRKERGVIAGSGDTR